jgi:hypothetical protein
VVRAWHCVLAKHRRRLCLCALSLTACVVTHQDLSLSSLYCMLAVVARSFAASHTHRCCCWVQVDMLSRLVRHASKADKYTLAGSKGCSDLPFRCLRGSVHSKSCTLVIHADAVAYNPYIYVHTYTVCMSCKSSMMYAARQACTMPVQRHRGPDV